MQLFSCPSGWLFGSYLISFFLFLLVFICVFLFFYFCALFVCFLFISVLTYQKAVTVFLSEIPLFTPVFSRYYLNWNASDD